MEDEKTEVTGLDGWFDVIRLAGGRAITADHVLKSSLKFLVLG